MCDVTVTQVPLQAASIDSPIGQRIPRGMSKLVGMYPKPEVGDLTGSRNDLLEGIPRHRPASLGNKHVGALWIFPLQSTQCPYLVPSEWVLGV